MSSNAHRLHVSRNRSEANAQAKDEDLLVFGYSCKLFRDDSKALWLDQGHHLIPWNEDSTLCDSRDSEDFGMVLLGMNNTERHLTVVLSFADYQKYDCRLHLHSLSDYETGPVNHTAEFSEEENTEEQLCDFERYLDLERDIAEETILKEEEAKRQQVAENVRGAMIPFNYGDGEQNTADDEYDPEKPTEVDQMDSGVKTEIQEPFEPAAELKLPPGIEWPQSIKHNAIIEKTALFVAQNGAQMEIIIKTKQSRNPLFKFMDWENSLYKYYKHLVKMIKEKKYIPLSQDVKKEEEEEESDSDDEGGYLHPSLLAGAGRASSASVPSAAAHKTSVESGYVGSHVPRPSKYKIGEGNDVYSQLYNRLSALAGTGDASKKEDDSKAEEPLYSQEYEQTEDPHLVMQQAALSVQQQSLYNFYYPMQTQVDFNALNQIPVVPPPDLKPVVDRMAEYVVRNGPEFEVVVRNRNDPRFDFINQSSPYYGYYQLRLSQIAYYYGAASAAMYSPAPTAVEVASATTVKAKTATSGDQKKETLPTTQTKELKPLHRVAPISFALKQKPVKKKISLERKAQLQDSDEETRSDASPCSSSDSQTKTFDAQFNSGVEAEDAMIAQFDQSAAGAVPHETTTSTVFESETVDSVVISTAVNNHDLSSSFCGESSFAPQDQQQQSSAGLIQSSRSTMDAFDEQQLEEEALQLQKLMQQAADRLRTIQKLKEDYSEASPQHDDIEPELEQRTVEPNTSQVETNITSDVRVDATVAPPSDADVKVAVEMEAEKLKLERKKRAAEFLRTRLSDSLASAPVPSTSDSVAVPPTPGVDKEATSSTAVIHKSQSSATIQLSSDAYNDGTDSSAKRSKKKRKQNKGKKRGSRSRSRSNLPSAYASVEEESRRKRHRKHRSHSKHSRSRSRERNSKRRSRSRSSDKRRRSRSSSQHRKRKHAK